MIIFIITLTTFCILTVTFIIKTLLWIVDKQSDSLRWYKLLSRSTSIIEKAYRGVDYKSTFTYIDYKDLLAINNPIFNDTNVVQNEEHKQYMIKQQIHYLVEKMLKDGVIEIKETKGCDDFTYSTYHNQTRIDLKLKVYIPEK